MVKNAQLGGTWTTILDNNIMGHEDPEVVMSMLAKIEDQFLGLGVQRGKEVDFLGINIKFRDERKVYIDMISYLKGMIKDFKEEIGKQLSREYVNPAGK